MERFATDKIKAIKEQYPKGSRVILIKMDDPQAPAKGTEGTVEFVDDIGTVHVTWDTGEKLGAILDEDVIKIKKHTIKK